MNAGYDMVKMINRYMSFIIVIVSAVGLFFPFTMKWAVKYIPYMLGIIMFGMGLTLKKEDFSLIMKKPYYVLVGSFSQFTIMPILAYALAVIFKLPDNLAIGVILVGCVPGGTASNVITYLAKGDVALSVTMTSISTILSSFITPILIYFLAGKWITVSIIAMFITIVKIIIAPILIGILTRHFFSHFVDKHIKIMPPISIVTIALACGAIIGQNSGMIMTSGFLIAIIVVVHNMLGFLLGYYFSKIMNIPERERRAVSIEVGMQNSGLASSLAVAHFNPLSAVPGAIFSVWHNISGGILANIWRNR